MARLERLFKATDTNGNGVLDACEFRALVPTDVVVHLGEDGVAALFRRLDTNATGVIEIEEMQPLMLEVQAIQVHMKGFRTAAESPSRASRRMGGRRASSLSGVTRRLSIIRSEHAVAEADRAREIAELADAHHSALAEKHKSRLLRHFSSADLGGGRFDAVALGALLPTRVATHLGAEGARALVGQFDRSGDGVIELGELHGLMTEVHTIEKQMVLVEKGAMHLAARTKLRALAAGVVQRYWREHAREQRAAQRLECAARLIQKFFWLLMYSRAHVGSSSSEEEEASAGAGERGTQEELAASAGDWDATMGCLDNDTDAASDADAGATAAARVADEANTKANGAATASAEAEAERVWRERPQLAPTPRHALRHGGFAHDSVATTPGAATAGARALAAALAGGAAAATLGVRHS